MGITVEGTTQEDVDKLKDLISRVDGISVNQQDSNLMNIITEEAEAYFTGQKSWMMLQVLYKAVLPST